MDGGGGGGGGEHSRQTIVEIILKGRGSRLRTDFLEPIHIREGHCAEIGLKSFCFFNSIPNITKGVNNCIKISLPGRKSYDVIELDTGAYELSSIAKEIVEWIKIKYPKVKNVEENFILSGNEATSRAEFTFREDYGFDMDTPHSMAAILGFSENRKERGIGKYRGDRIVDISNVSSLLFNCNISEPNYINEIQTPFLFNCTIDVPSGFRLTRELSSVVYKNVNTNQISSVCVWISDQSGRVVDLRNEVVLVTLSLRLTSPAI